MTHHYQSGKNMKKIIRKVFAEIVAEGDICKKNKLEAPVFGYLVYVRVDIGFRIRTGGEAKSDKYAFKEEMVQIVF
jgi:hypothetical protein